MTRVFGTTSAEVGDRELLLAYARNREDATFTEIVRRHGGMVLSVCRSVLGNVPDAEDAAQAVFLTLAKKASSWGARRSLVGWLHRVAWYVATRSARARAIRRMHEKEAAVMKKELFTELGEAVPLEALHAGLAELPEKYRVVLLLHHVEGRTQEETAALLGCGVSAVAMRLNRGREKLRARLAKRGRDVTAAGMTGILGAQAVLPVSRMFVEGTAKAAAAALSGHAAAGVTMSALALKEGALKMLYWAKMKSLAAMVTAVLMVGTASAMVARQAMGATTATPHAETTTTTQPAVTGTITAVGTDGISIHTNSGVVRVTFNGDTKITVGGKAAGGGDLKVGMRVYALGATGQPATQITAYVPTTTTTSPTTHPTTTTAAVTVTGTITAVGADGLTLETSTGSVRVLFNSATKINVGGKPAGPGDLKVGMRGYATGVTGQPATLISAYAPTTTTTSPATHPTTTTVQPNVSGTITAASGDGITIETTTGSVRVPFNSATKITVGGKAAGGGDLKVGMRAYAIVTTGQPATQISAYVPTTTSPATHPTTTTSTTHAATEPNVAGTITQVGTGWMMVQVNTTTIVTVAFGNGTTFNVGGKAATAGDLKAGMRVYAIVPTGQPATEVRAYVQTTTTTTTHTGI